MWGFVMRLLVIVCYFHLGSLWPSNVDPVEEWNRMASQNPTPGVMPKAFKSHSDGNYLYLPDSVVGTADNKDIFRPEIGERPLPHSVKTILFPPHPVAPPLPVNPVVEMLCHLDRIYVRIQRSIFRTRKPWRYLKLGKCLVNQGTREHFYFLYLLSAECGFIFENELDKLIVKNVIHFWPTLFYLRDMPFEITVHCNYHRYIHAYQVGIRPKIQGGTLYKVLRGKRKFVLIAQDANGNEMKKPYKMGETMYFEVKPVPDGTLPSVNERIYITKCIISSHPYPSSPENAIIDNNGCMMDGLEFADSRFLTGHSMNTQKFSVKAGILLEMVAMESKTKQLFMHCDVHVGPHSPSQSFKACNYELKTRKWRELYGDDSVCSCCGSECLPLLRSPRNKVTSLPWSVKFSYKDDVKEDIDDDIETDNEVDGMYSD